MESSCRLIASLEFWPSHWLNFSVSIPARHLLTRTLTTLKFLIGTFTPCFGRRWPCWSWRIHDFETSFCCIFVASTETYWDLIHDCPLSFCFTDVSEKYRGGTVVQPVTTRAARAGAVGIGRSLLLFRLPISSPGIFGLARTAVTAAFGQSISAKLWECDTQWLRRARREEAPWIWPGSCANKNGASTIKKWGSAQDFIRF